MPAVDAMLVPEECSDVLNLIAEPLNCKGQKSGLYFDLPLFLESSQNESLAEALQSL